MKIYISIYRYRKIDFLKVFKNLILLKLNIMELFFYKNKLLRNMIGSLWYYLIFYLFLFGFLVSRLYFDWLEFLVRGSYN